MSTSAGAPAAHAQVVTTHDDRAVADQISAAGVAARLAACAQVDGPITSTYWWDGELEHASEWRVTFKTRTDLVPALVEHIRAAHTYDVPEIVATPILGGLPDYLAWIDTETAAPAAQTAG